MKIRMTLLLVAVFAVLLTLGNTAQAVTVYTDTAGGANDLGLPNANPLAYIGPGGLGDNTPFGAGTWDVTGAINQISLGDDGDGFNWSTSGTFDLSWNVPGGGFTRWSSGADNWGAGNVSLDVNTGNVNGLAAGTYSGGFFESSPSSWTWSITVQAVPEPSSFALAGLGAIGIGLVGWRKRRSRK